jgi:hypothetical protein
LVASVHLWGPYGEEQYTFQPPYVPELNEFFARTMHFNYDALRVEPDRVGLVIGATDHDSFINALPVSELVGRMFGLAGLRTKPSGGGLITRQLISRLGGIEGARVFKIPGVRRLLKTYGPRATFTKRNALQLIGSNDPANPDARFDDHRQLYIEARPGGGDLTPPMVFEYLVERGLFRIGADLECPTCKLKSWIGLDELKQANVCELCGAPFDATRQLVAGEFHYRRTGVLGLEKNTQGAVPVALVLQQLTNNMRGGRDLLYVGSLDVEPAAGHDPAACEVDFVLVRTQRFAHEPVMKRTAVLIGECKDQGGSIDANDVENLRKIADSLPAHRFGVFIVLAKLAPFTAEEIALARTLNGRYERRVIMLTDRELEPYRIYERTKKEFKIERYAGSPEDLANATATIYFGDH